MCRSALIALPGPWTVQDDLPPPRRYHDRLFGYATRHPTYASIGNGTAAHVVSRVQIEWRNGRAVRVHPHVMCRVVRDLSVTFSEPPTRTDDLCTLCARKLTRRERVA